MLFTLSLLELNSLLNMGVDESTRSCGARAVRRNTLAVAVD